MPVPVDAWARAYGLIRDPGSGRHAISLIGPGPHFSPGYAMTTNPDEPAILATLADASGETTPLLIDGYALPVTVRSEAVAAVWRYPVPLGRLTWGSACVRGSLTMPMSFGWIWGQGE